MVDIVTTICRSKKPIPSPISRLPEEVLLLVFLHHTRSANITHQYDPLTWTAYTRVCARWRAIALQCSRLWRYICLSVAPGDRWLCTFFDRSKEMRLVVAMTEQWGEESLSRLDLNMTRVCRLAVAYGLLGQWSQRTSLESPSMLTSVVVYGSWMEPRSHGVTTWAPALPLFRTLTTLRLSYLEATRSFLDTVSGITALDAPYINPRTALSITSTLQDESVTTILPSLLILILENLHQVFPESSHRHPVPDSNAEVHIDNDHGILHSESSIGELDGLGAGSEDGDLGDDEDFLWDADEGWGDDEGSDDSGDEVHSGDEENGDVGAVRGEEDADAELATENDENDDTERFEEDSDEEEGFEELDLSLLVQLCAFVGQRARAKIPLHVLRLDLCSATCGRKREGFRVLDSLAYFTEIRVQCLRCGGYSEKGECIMIYLSVNPVEY